MEETLADIRERNVPCVEFILEHMNNMVDGMDVQLLAEIMANDFLVRKPDALQALVLYIYMIVLIMVELESEYGFIRYWEPIWGKLVKLRNKYVRFLLEEYRQVFNI